MSDFATYLQLGFQHITDLQGYDHMLFILALCAIYRPADWRALLWLVTAFTLGHSLTLALAALNIVQVRSDIIEFLIPVTIFLTAAYNVFFAEKSDRFHGGRYWLAAIFGLIHGLGFSNYLRSLLGKDASIVGQLFAFNVGLEVGQLLIVAVIMAVSALVVASKRMAFSTWSTWISGIAAGAALVLATDKWVF